ncbi:MAG: hypothetical protein AAF840_02690 [Bacteroidota bacterium]
MLGKLLRFELKNRLWQWMTLLFAGMMIFQGLWYTKGFYDFYGGDGMLLNASGVNYQNLAGGGILLIIIVSVITVPTLHKDIQYHSAGWLYAYPIGEKQFFLGRFLAAYLANVCIASFYLVGMLLTPYVGIGEVSLFGPAPIGPMLHGFCFLVLPNMFLLTAAIFCALVIFKKPAAGYLVVFATVFSFLMMETSSEASGYTTMNLTLDPFAYVPVSKQIGEMPISLRNYGYLSFTGPLLYNRILWGSIAIIVFVIAYLRFSFKGYTNSTNKRPKSVSAPAPAVATAGIILPKVQKAFGAATMLHKLWHQAGLELSNIIRPTNFRIIASILVLMCVLQNLIWNFSFYIGPTVPVTSTMTSFRLANGVILVMLLMIWAGELFFKDRTVGIWPITGALPVPVWVSQLAKLLAMYGVALIFNLIFLVSSIGTQVALGGAAEVDLGLFIHDYLGYAFGWLTHCFYISLVFCLAGLTGRRFLTHVVGVGYFFLLIIIYEFGLVEDLRFGFGFTPGVEDYSEMNGYGIFSTAAFWYALMWFTIAVVMVLVGVLTWDRGLARRAGAKLSWKSKQLNWGGKLAIPVLLLLFIGLQSFIYQQVSGLDNFESSSAADAAAADYERTYGHLQAAPSMVYTALDLELNLFPAARHANYSVRAELTELPSLGNSKPTATDTLFLSLPGKVVLTQSKINGTAIDPILDDRHDVAALVLPSASDTSTVLELELTKTYRGFPQGDPQAPLAFQGAFAGLEEYLPVIGFDRSKRLEANRTRRAAGLEVLPSLLPAQHDAAAIQKDAYRPDAAPLVGTIRLSVPAAHTPVAPGTIVSDQTDSDRRIVTYRVDKPVPLHWYLGSANYTAVRSSESTSFSIYHQPGHHYNVAAYAKHLRTSKEFVTKKLGSYPYQDVRLYEVLRFNAPVHVFPNGIAINEQEGWIADTTAVKEQAYLLLTVTSGIARHWVLENIRVANVRGAEMLTVALPEALALLHVAETFGEEAITPLREAKEKLYNKERHSDPNGEPALVEADGKEYLEINQGALMLFDWAEEVGPEVLYQLTQALAKEQPVVFANFLEDLLTNTPADRRTHWRNIFTKQ